MKKAARNTALAAAVLISAITGVIMCRDFRAAWAMAWTQKFELSYDIKFTDRAHANPSDALWDWRKVRKLSQLVAILKSRRSQEWAEKQPRYMALIRDADDTWHSVTIKQSADQRQLFIDGRNQ